MFVRGGSVNPGLGLYSAGGLGFYWSSVGGSSYYVYGLSFDLGYVGPSDSIFRYLGLSVRCVALGG